MKLVVKRQWGSRRDTRLPLWYKCNYNSDISETINHRYSYTSDLLICDSKSVLRFRPLLVGQCSQQGDVKILQVGRGNKSNIHNSLIV